MKYILILLTPLFLYGAGSFISPIEYASQLYKNPRGIGCQKCHGENGEGKVIATYKHKGEQKSFDGPAINKLEYRYFYKELNKRKKGMPRYFLTDKEVQALYLYLHHDERAKMKEKPIAK
ncbi:c-type cytochrome [Sulfurimonas aquatica]|uniref:C-type cytochrome n=1 Tax=Sulfurimonas aquatica TaxID=2672570 RepID=A0A975B003_9BACT|nr:c-type cytochrome [Sulfurimonas aquatica]QSZ41717.1 c-type cytochrome [Sulfurimonas aquatica]